MKLQWIICFHLKYIVNRQITVEHTAAPLPFTIDTLGNIIWKSSKVSFGYPAGFFRKDNKIRFYFAELGRYFKVIHLDITERKEINILDYHYDYSKQLFGLPHHKDWRVIRIGINRFLAVGYRLSKAEGDSIYVFTFITNSEGEILQPISLINVRDYATILRVKRNSIGSDVYFNNFDYFGMPDSTVFFIFGTMPKMEMQKWTGDEFLLYILKFTKDGEIVPFKNTPSIFPLRSLSSNYRVKGFNLRFGRSREFWDYAVDSLGNFYVEIRKYSLNRE